MTALSALEGIYLTQAEVGDQDPGQVSGTVGVRPVMSSRGRLGGGSLAESGSVFSLEDHRPERGWPVMTTLPVRRVMVRLTITRTNGGYAV